MILILISEQVKFKSKTPNSSLKIKKPLALCFLSPHQRLISFGGSISGVCSLATRQSHQLNLTRAIETRESETTLSPDLADINRVGSQSSIFVAKAAKLPTENFRTEQRKTLKSEVFFFHRQENCFSASTQLQQQMSRRPLPVVPSPALT